MSWVKDVKIRKVDRAPPLSLEEGEHLLEVIEEPDGPVNTRFGERLVYRVKKRGEEEVRSLFIPYRGETSETSALGQLRMLTEKHGSLEGKMLRIVIAGKGRSKRYSFSLVEQTKLGAESAKEQLLSALEPGASYSFEEVRGLAEGLTDEEVRKALLQLEAEKRLQRVSIKAGDRFVFLG